MKTKASKKRKARRTVRDNGPLPIDEHVGKRIRSARNLAGLSQTELATQIDLTFQQLQKYERGFNRVSASKLYAISNILGYPVGWFFEGMKGATRRNEEYAGDKQFNEQFDRRLTLELVRNFGELSEPVQKDFHNLVKSISKQEARAD